MKQAQFDQFPWIILSGVVIQLMSRVSSDPGPVFRCRPRKTGNGRFTGNEPGLVKGVYGKGGIGYVVQPRALPYILTGPSGCLTLSERELLRIPKG